MADLELVIKIDEELYNNLKSLQFTTFEEDIIINGTPLPKGHGRLIDADALQTEMEKDVRKAMSFVDLKDFVWLAPTIIEADKESEE